jgi:hypothetical protein
VRQPRSTTKTNHDESRGVVDILGARQLVPRPINDCCNVSFLSKDAPAYPRILSNKHVEEEAQILRRF